MGFITDLQNQCFCYERMRQEKAFPRAHQAIPGQHWSVAHKGLQNPGADSLGFSQVRWPLLLPVQVQTVLTK